MGTFPHRGVTHDARCGVAEVTSAAVPALRASGKDDMDVNGGTNEHR